MVRLVIWDAIVSIMTSLQWSEQRFCYECLYILALHYPLPRFVYNPQHSSRTIDTIITTLRWAPYQHYQSRRLDRTPWQLWNNMFIINMPHNIFEHVGPITCKHRKGWNIVPVPYKFSGSRNKKCRWPAEFDYGFARNKTLNPTLNWHRVHYIFGIHRMFSKGFISPLIYPITGIT